MFPCVRFILVFSMMVVSTAMAQVPSVWERQSYRVAVCLDVTAAAALRLPPQKNAELVASLENHITLWKSPYWVWQNFEGNTSPNRTPDSSSDTVSLLDTAVLSETHLVEKLLQAKTGFLADEFPELLAQAAQRQGCDKLFVIQVSYSTRIKSSSGGGAGDISDGEFRLAVRELDTMAGVLGDTIVVPVSAYNLAIPIITAMETVFAPVAKITHFGSSEVILVPRAVELAATSMTPSAVPTIPTAVVPTVFDRGDLLIPFIRVSLRDTPTGQIRPIPWTCLMVRTTTPDVVAVVETGAANPWITRSSGRAESFAIRPFLQPQDVHLQVTFRSTSNKLHTTPRYDIIVRDTIAETPHFVSLGTTDLRGRFLLKHETNTTDTEKFRMIYVRQGRSTLAKLPVIFGWQSELTIPVVDDTNRLGAEAVLWDIQQRVLDIAAQRELLKIPISNDMERRQIQDTATVRHVQQNDIPTMETVLIQLEIERLKWKSDDPAVQKRITAMFKETEMVIRKTLQPM